MKLSYNWLKEYVSLPENVQETADTLTLIGLEEEETQHIGASLDQIIVGEIRAVTSHPNADRLSICTVFDGDKELQIVCGANNITIGQKVPVAPVNSTLPIQDEQGRLIKIKKTKLRGVVSEGMICAEDELGISDDHAGIMVLPSGTTPGIPLSELISSYQDSVIEIAITPNRPDATSHIGVARDLSAKWDIPLNVPTVTIPEQVSGQGKNFSISIEDNQKCRRYVGVVIKNIQVSPSPAWLKNRLEAIGLRSINNIVDVTNYVMYEWGQPLHAFDADNIKGSSIHVKSFEETYKFTTLDGAIREVPRGSLFICDDEQAIAIAGIMGGENSEVSDSTTTIVLESAYFDPSIIRKCAKQLSLQTDASYRFERGIDSNIQLTAAMRAADLIKEMNPDALITETIDLHPLPKKTLELSLRVSRVNQILGVDIDEEWIINKLNRLEITSKRNGSGTIECLIPSFRPDIEREIDLIEEIGRLYDYNNIPSPTNGINLSSSPFSDWELDKQKIIESLVGLGFNEIYSNSLISEAEASLYGDLDQMVATLNPLTKDMTTLRPSLLPGFLKANSYNKNRNAKSLRFFELGNVFFIDTNGTFHRGIGEQTNVLFGLAGLKQEDHWLSPSSKYTFMDLKSSVQSLWVSLGLDHIIKEKIDVYNSLHYYIGEQYIGKLSQVNKSLQTIYELDEAVYFAEFNVQLIHEARREVRVPTFSKIPKFPGIEYDIALVMDKEIAAGTIETEISHMGTKLLQKIRIFDVYEGKNIPKNKKSIAYRMYFLDPNKTLNISDIEPIIDKVVRSLNKKYTIELRS
ncbi:MAG: phenylalanine--tRNA ligase subunit beta [Bacteroidota bacterium]|nr:phenylalanine--tRNA ligase subunit beta [Bacteroidota bacterium]